MNPTSVGLEEILTEHLRPVAAPAGLRFPTARAREPRRTWNALRLAAAALIVAAGTEAVLHLRLANPGVEFPCESASQLAAWVKQNSGVDVPLPAALPDAVRLVGASRVAGGVELVYTVAGKTEKVRISSALSPSAGHALQEHPVNTVAWTLDGHLYQVEQGDSSLACKLCHSGV